MKKLLWIIPFLAIVMMYTGWESARWGRNNIPYDFTFNNDVTFEAKLKGGSLASPIDVTSTRQYGLEFYYGGNNYDVTAARLRAILQTTDAGAKTATGAIIQASNSDGIDAYVLNGALIEAIGKGSTTASRIDYMRGLLVNTEWGAKDTIDALKILHLRTHTLDATGDGCFDGTGYGLYIENEAVGGNGQALDAAVYLKGTNLSGGNKAFTYGLDFSGVATDIATADWKLRNGGLIDNPHADTIKITEANINLEGIVVLENGGTITNLGDTVEIAGAMVKIGDAGTVNTADGDGDLYVEDELEVDGAGSFVGSITMSEHILQDDDDGYLNWYGYRWFIDTDNDDALALISFHAEDSIKVDTSKHALEWTGSGGIDIGSGKITQETYVIRKFVSLEGAADNVATAMFTITTTDETGSADGGMYSVTVHTTVGEATAASGAVNTASVGLLTHWTRIMASAGTGANSAIVEVNESASADEGTGAITAVTMTVAETSEFVQTVSIQVDTSGGTVDAFAVVELVYSDFTTAPVIQ